MVCGLCSIRVDDTNVMNLNIRVVCARGDQKFFSSEEIRWFVFLCSVRVDDNRCHELERSWCVCVCVWCAVREAMFSSEDIKWFVFLWSVRVDDNKCHEPERSCVCVCEDCFRAKRLNGWWFVCSVRASMITVMSRTWTFLPPLGCPVRSGVCTFGIVFFVSSNGEVAFVYIDDEHTNKQARVMVPWFRSAPSNSLSLSLSLSACVVFCAFFSRTFRTIPFSMSTYFFENHVKSRNFFSIVFSIFSHENVCSSFWTIVSVFLHFFSKTFNSKMLIKLESEYFSTNFWRNDQMHSRIQYFILQEVQLKATTTWSDKSTLLRTFPLSPFPRGH